MSLITKILKPEQFTAATISKGTGIPEEIAQYALYQLGARGIIGQTTAILQPERFNSTTIAVLLYERIAGPNGWDKQTEAARMQLIDQVQAFLDQWKRDGVIG